MGSAKCVLALCFGSTIFGELALAKNPTREYKTHPTTITETGEGVPALPVPRVRPPVPTPMGEQPIIHTFNGRRVPPPIAIPRIVIADGSPNSFVEIIRLQNVNVRIPLFVYLSVESMGTLREVNLFLRSLFSKILAQVRMSQFGNEGQQAAARQTPEMRAIGVRDSLAALGLRDLGSRAFLELLLAAIDRNEYQGDLRISIERHLSRLLPGTEWYQAVRWELQKLAAVHPDIYAKMLRLSNLNLGRLIKEMLREQKK